MRWVMNNLNLLLPLFFGFLIVTMIARFAYDGYRKKKIKELAGNNTEVSIDEFFRLRQATLKTKGKHGYRVTDDFIGVYIIFNKTKNMYYVGQAKKVMQRVNAHFTGHGNGDVYADYKHGDEFTIKTISINSSGYDSLDKLEKDTIQAYNAFSQGYNKTRGNS